MKIPFFAFLLFFFTPKTYSDCVLENRGFAFIDKSTPCTNFSPERYIYEIEGKLKIKCKNPERSVSFKQGRPHRLDYDPFANKKEILRIKIKMDSSKKSLYHPKLNKFDENDTKSEKLIVQNFKGPKEIIKRHTTVLLHYCNSTYNYVFPAKDSLMILMFYLQTEMDIKDPGLIDTLMKIFALESWSREEAREWIKADSSKL